MGWQAITLASVFSIVGFFCVLMVPVGLPGVWIMLALAVAVEFADAFVTRVPETVTFGWALLGACAGLGLVGEALEAVAGAFGTRMGGGTGRGMWGAILGGIVGAIALTILLPIPLVGTLIGAMVGTFVGAFVGEATGEASRERTHAENVRAALAATLGRLAGTAGKTVVAAFVWGALVWGAFHP